MTIAQSKLTARGRIPVPAAVRKEVGIGPGSTLEWQEEGDKLKQGLRTPAMRRHARR